MARALLIAGVGVTAASMPPAQAAAWSWAAQSRLGMGYDDNIRLTAVNEDASAHLSADLSADLSHEDERYKLRISPRLSAVRYDKLENFNRTEQYLTLGARYLREHSSSDLNFNWTQDTTLTSELGTTGLTEVDRRRRNAAVDFTHLATLSERLQATAKIYAVANRYVDAASTGLIDYNYGSVGVGPGYALTEAAQLSLQISAGRLQVPEFRAFDKTNYAIALNYEVRFSELWRGSLSVGPSRVSSNGGNDDGTVYAAGIARNADPFNFRVDVKRDVTPTGRGSLTRREQASLNLSKALRERLYADVNLLWVRNRDVLPAGGLELHAVRYADIACNIGWRMTPSWTLSLGAGHSRQIERGFGRWARRSHVAVNVNWSGLRHDLR